MTAKELLTKYLNGIGWSLRPCGCDHYMIQDHENNDTGYMLWGSEISAKSNNTVTAFTISEQNIKLTENENVCVGTNDNIVLFMNHDMADKIKID